MEVLGPKRKRPSPLAARNEERWLYRKATSRQIKMLFVDKELSFVQDKFLSSV